MSEHIIVPHGGELVDLIATVQRAEELKNLPKGTLEQPGKSPLRLALRRRIDLLAELLATLEKQTTFAAEIGTMKVSES